MPSFVPETGNRDPLLKGFWSVHAGPRARYREPTPVANRSGARTPPDRPDLVDTNRIRAKTHGPGGVLETTGRKVNCAGGGNERCRYLSPHTDTHDYRHDRRPRDCVGHGGRLGRPRPDVARLLRGASVDSHSVSCLPLRARVDPRDDRSM